MKILIAGAGETGAHVIQQLRKNKSIQIQVLDPRNDAYAVKEGIIDKIDFKESLTPLNLDYILNKSKPDLILLTTEPADMGLGNLSGLDLLSESMNRELAETSSIPIINVTHTRH